MIEQKWTRIFNTEHRPVETSHIIPDEGCALVFVKEQGQTKVRLSTGTAGEIFAGFSWARNNRPDMLPFALEDTVNGGTLELPRVPMANQLLVRIDGDAKTIGAGNTAPTDSTSVNVDGDMVYFHPDHDGKSLFVQMLYEPTVAEARANNGDDPVGGLPSDAQGIIGTITRGDVATTFFDASVDWRENFRAYLGPDGFLTDDSGAGEEARGVIVLEAPSAGAPFLVVNTTL